MDLNGAVALVTGASGGIGAAVSVALRRRGACLLVHGRGGPGLDRLAEEIDATPLAVDLTDADGASRLADKAIAVHGSVDVLVHCAGIGQYGAFEELGAGRLDRLIDVNLRSPLQLTRSMLPQMLGARRGHVAFVASIAGLTGVAREAVYSATKAGLIGFADSLALELAGTGVTVSAICPGPVDTGFFAARGARYERRLPRPIHPARVAEDVVSAIEHNRGRTVVPKWLAVAPTIRDLFPAVYYPLARRFG